VADGAVWVGVAALAGGRALYLLQIDLPDLAMHPLHVFTIWHGGLSFYGGLVAAVAALLVFARRRGLAFGVAADVVAPAAAAGQTVGHIGCFIGGDSHGLPTTLPWAVTYTNPAAMAPLGVPLHPTQLHEAVGLGVLALALWLGRIVSCGSVPGQSRLPISSATPPSASACSSSATMWSSPSGARSSTRASRRVDDDLVRLPRLARHETILPGSIGSH